MSAGEVCFIGGSSFSALFFARFRYCRFHIPCSRPSIKPDDFCGAATKISYRSPWIIRTLVSVSLAAARAKAALDVRNWASTADNKATAAASSGRGSKRYIIWSSSVVCDASSMVLFVVTAQSVTSKTKVVCCVRLGPGLVGMRNEESNPEVDSSAG